MDRARRPRIRRTDLVVAATALLASAGGAASTLALLHATLDRNMTGPAITGRPNLRPTPARTVVLDVERRREPGRSLANQCSGAPLTAQVTGVGDLM